MIRTPRARIAAAAGAGLLAACTQAELPADSQANPPADRCASSATCVLLTVDSLVIRKIDQVELDLVYPGQHATITTGTLGTTIDLPSSFPLTLDLADPPVIQVDLVAAGKLGGSVLGLDTNSIQVQQGQQTSVRFLLQAVGPCVEGALYCGGTEGASGPDIDALYRCIGGIPTFYAACSSGCTRPFEPNGVCFGGGLCRDGGTYCGGDQLDGDPSTLYVCSDFVGTNAVPCPAGCVVRGSGNDACK